MAERRGLDLDAGSIGSIADGEVRVERVGSGWLVAPMRAGVARRRIATMSHREGTMSESHAAVIIIGSGSAGLTAALYAARANLAPLVFEGKEPGGQLTLTTAVDNFPGFPDGIIGPGPDGPDAQAGPAVRRRLQSGRPSSRSICRGGRSGSGRPTIPAAIPSSGTIRDYTSDALIVATGASARWLGIEGPLPRQRRQHLRHLRRPFLPRQGDRRRRRRRLGRRGGDLPDPVRHQGHADPPPRRPAGLQDHAGSRCAAIPRSPTPGTRSSTKSRAKRKAGTRC